MADVYLVRPDGQVVAVPQEDAQAAADAGYTPYENAQEAQAADIKSRGDYAAFEAGQLEAPADYDRSRAALDKVASGLTFGGALLGRGNEIESLKSRAIGRRFVEEHPYQAFGAELAGQLPYAVGTGLAGGAARAALGGGARGLAADVALNAAVGGAQTEAETARLEGRDFNWTDAAITGVAGEVLGRNAAWAVSRGVGGARNLLTRAERNAVAADASSSLAKGGWVRDYQTAQHAEQYLNQLSDLSARDLDSLETAFDEVSRQDRKRARATRAVEDRPGPQAEIALEATEGLRRLRGSLEAELAQAPAGPARRLAAHLEARIAELDAAPRGRQLWRTLDENRQALQEFRQDLHQAYSDNPGSAWLSRAGLEAIDQAEEATRNALLREDAWGQRAVQVQREYNVPFHEKWFPASKTVRSQLHFVEGLDAKGFPVYRGDPERVRKFLTGLGQPGPDGHRTRELFAQYLDGAEGVARAGAQDAPRASRDALEAVRRLRKAMANAELVNAAQARTARRGAAVGGAATVAGALGGLAAAGPVGGLVGGAAVRGARLGDWLGRVGSRLGWFAGAPLDMADLLKKGELPASTAPELSERMLDDLADAPRRPPPAPFPSALPPTLPPGPVGVAPTVGVGVTPERGPSTFPGVGQARRAAGDRPAGAYAVQPNRQVEIEPLGELDEGSLPPAGPSSGPPGRPTPLDDLSGPPPSMLSESQLPDPGALADDLHAGRASTVPAPVHAEAMAFTEHQLGGIEGRRARAADARRAEALTQGEFREIVDHLRATEAKTPAGESMADELEFNLKDFEDEGLVESPRPTKAPAGSKRALQARVAVDELTELGHEVADREFVAEGLDRIFGEKFPDAATFQKMMPLDTLETLGEASFSKVQRVGDDVFWVAEGPISTVGPHTDYAGVFDEGGYEAPAWKIARTYSHGPDGPEVYHDYFYLRGDLQGAGVGAEVLKNQLDAYRKLGVVEVAVSADQVGKYFWPSIGFDKPSAVPSARQAYERWLVNTKGLTPEAAKARTKGIRSLPGLAQAEDGKEFLLAVAGPWNTGLSLRLADDNPLYHLMRGRLNLELAALAALGGAVEAAGDPDREAQGGAQAGVNPALLAFGGRVALFKQLRQKLVSDVAKKLFSATAEATARTTARLVYSRADIDRRNAEFSSWQQNPQELVDRVAEGFRDVPAEHTGAVNAGVFATASFLKTKLPSVTKLNAVSMRQIPVSTDQALKYARYEQAALEPQAAWREASESGHLSAELLETTQELYPDLLAEIRVGAYLNVREAGPPASVQARVNYARLFDGDGRVADPAFSDTVARMAAFSYENSVPEDRSAPPPAPRVSQVAGFVAPPSGLAPVAG